MDYISLGPNSALSGVATGICLACVIGIYIACVVGAFVAFIMLRR